MNRARKLLLLGGGSQTIAQRFEAAIAGIGFELQYHLRETSGTTILNSGSTGAALNGTLTIGAGALAQTGIMGTGEALLFDGADTRIATPNNAAISDQTAFEWVFVAYPTGYGESNVGAFFEYFSTVTRFRGNGSAGSVSAVVNYDTTDASAATANGVMTLNEWQVFNVAFDSAVEARPRIYRNGSLTTDASVTLGVGSVTAEPNGVSIGNSPFSNRTFAGSIDFAARKNGRTLTAPERAAIVTALGL